MVMAGTYTDYSSGWGIHLGNSGTASSPIILKSQTPGAAVIDGQNASDRNVGFYIDGNYNSRPDVLWNGFNLFILVYELNTQAKLYKFTYNSSTKLYTVVAGFPITMPLIGIGNGTTQSQAGSITLAQDSTGKLWAAYPGTGPGDTDPSALYCQSWLLIRCPLAAVP